MNSKFKKTVSAVSALTIAVSTFSGIAVTASAVGADSIGSSASAETLQDKILDNVKFYLQAAPSDAVIGTTKTIAPSSIDYAYGYDGVTKKDTWSYSNGLIGNAAAKADFAVHYAGVSFKDTGVTDKAPISIVIPFDKLPADTRTIKLYTGTKKPTNVANGLAGHNTAFAIGSKTIWNFATEYITEQINGKTPFAVVTFGSVYTSATPDAQGNTPASQLVNRTYTVSTLDGESVVDAKVIADGGSVEIPIGAASGAAVKTADEVFVVSSDSGNGGGSGAFGTMTVNFAAKEKTTWSVDLADIKNTAENVYYLGKVNTIDLDAIQLYAEGDGNVTASVYGVPAAAPSGTVSFSDSYKIGEAVLDSNVSIKVTPNDNNRNIYVVLTPAKGAWGAVNSASADYLTEPDAASRMAADTAQYLLENTNASNYTKLSDYNARIADINTLKKDSSTATVFENYKAQYQYITEIAKAWSVSDKINNDIKPLSDEINGDYMAALAKSGARDKVAAVRAEYEDLLTTGQAFVNNYSVLSALISLFENGDKAAADKYANAAAAVSDVSEFDASDINSATSVIAKEAEIKAFLELAAVYNKYDSAAKTAIEAAVAGDKTVSQLAEELNGKVDAYKTAIASAFNAAYPDAERAFAASKTDEERSNALKTKNIDKIYALIKNSKQYNDIKTLCNHYGDYEDFANQIAAYTAAQRFLTSKEKLQGDISAAGGVSVGTYEATAGLFTTTETLYREYETAYQATSNKNAVLHEQVKAEYEYLNSAKTLLDEAAEIITSKAQEKISKSYNNGVFNNTPQGAKDIKAAQHEYNILGANAKKYLDNKTLGEYTYGSYAAAVPSLISQAITANKTSITEAAESDNNGNPKAYDGYIDALDITAEIIYTSPKADDPKTEQDETVEEAWSIEWLEAIYNEGKTRLGYIDYYDDINKLLNGTFTGYDNNGNPLVTMKASESNALRTAFDNYVTGIVSKLKAIKIMQDAKARYDADVDALVKHVAEGKFYTDYMADIEDDPNTEPVESGTYVDETAIAEDVAAAVGANRIKLCDAPDFENDKYSADRVTEAKIKAVDKAVLDEAYGAYAEVIAEDIVAAEYMYGGAVEEEDVATAIISSVNSKIAELYGAARDAYLENKAAAEEAKRKAKVIADAKAAKENPAKAEAETVNAAVTALYDEVNEAVYTTAADGSAYADAVTEYNTLSDTVVSDTANTDYIYNPASDSEDPQNPGVILDTSAEKINYFTNYYTGTVNLAFAGALLSQWKSALEVYDEAKEAAAALEIAKNDSGDYYVAGASEFAAVQEKYNTLKTTPKELFNRSAENELGTDDFLGTYAAEIELESDVINNFANAVGVVPVIGTLVEYDSNPEYRDALDAIAEYYNALFEEGAADGAAKLELIEGTFAAEFKDYNDKSALYANLKGASDFSKLVASIGTIVGEGEEAREITIQDAIAAFDELIENNDAAVAYITKATMDSYKEAKAEYEEQMLAAYTSAVRTFISRYVPSITKVYTDDVINAAQADINAAYAALSDAHKALNEVEEAKAEVAQIVSANESYRAANAKAQDIENSIAKVKESYETDGDAVAALNAIKAIKNSYNELKNAGYSDHEIQSVAVSYAEVTNLEKTITEDMLVANANDKLAAIDLNNITVDTYLNTIAPAQTAYQAVENYDAANGTSIVNRVQNYAKLYAALDKFNALPEVKADQEAAAAIVDQIASIGNVTADSKAAIDAARAGYNALDAYAKTLVNNIGILDAAEAEYTALFETKPYDFTGDGKINVLDLNRAVQYALGNSSALTENQVMALDTDRNGRISLTELKAVVTAFTPVD